MEFKELLKSLSDQQITFLRRKAAGMNDTEAANGVCGRTSVHNWKKDAHFSAAYETVTHNPPLEVLQALSKSNETALVQVGEVQDLVRVDDLIEMLCLPEGLDNATIEQIRQMELIRLRIMAQRAVARTLMKPNISDKDRLSAAKILLNEPDVSQHLHLHGMSQAEYAAVAELERLRRREAHRKALEIVEGEVRNVTE